MIESAKSCEVDRELEIGKRRGVNLLRFLDSNITEMLNSNSNSNSNSNNDLDKDVFVTRLNRIQWMPKKTHFANDMLPLRCSNANDKSLLAAPKDMRPASDEWLCSSELHLLDGAIQNQTLLETFKVRRSRGGKILRG